jgi:hypothetical protein
MAWNVVYCVWCITINTFGLSHLPIPDHLIGPLNTPFLLTYLQARIASQ